MEGVGRQTDERGREQQGKGRGERETDGASREQEIDRRTRLWLSAIYLDASFYTLRILHFLLLYLIIMIIVIPSRIICSILKHLQVPPATIKLWNVALYRSSPASPYGTI